MSLNAGSIENDKWWGPGETDCGMSKFNDQGATIHHWFGIWWPAVRPKMSSIRSWFSGKVSLCPLPEEQSIAYKPVICFDLSVIQRIRDSVILPNKMSDFTNVLANSGTAGPISLILILKYLEYRQGLDGEKIWKNCKAGTENVIFIFSYKYI